MSLNKKPGAFFHLRRAMGWGGLPSLFLDSHVAEFVRVELGNEQVRAREDEQHENENHCCEDEHSATPFSNDDNITYSGTKSSSPNSTVCQVPRRDRVCVF